MNEAAEGGELDDVAALVETCNKSHAGFRDTVVPFMMNTGCPVGGLCGAQADNLELDKPRAKTFEKGNKGRVVLLNDQTVSTIEDWLETKPFADCEWLFRSLVKELPMNRNSVIEMLRRRAK